MSALVRTTDLGWTTRHVRKVPIPEVVAPQAGIHRKSGHLYATGGAARAATR
jgi:hypothetical protein